jgi:hypothetical protein
MGRLGPTHLPRGVAADLSRVDYTSDRLPNIIYRTDTPPATSLIFGSGKIVTTGAQSEDALYAALDQVFDALRELGISVPETPDVTVQNIVSSADLGEQIAARIRRVRRHGDSATVFATAIIITVSGRVLSLFEHIHERTEGLEDAFAVVREFDRFRPAAVTGARDPSLLLEHSDRIVHGVVGCRRVCFREPSVDLRGITLGEPAARQLDDGPGYFRPFRE